MTVHVSCSLTVCAVLKNWLMCGSLWDKMHAVVDFLACKHVTYLSLCMDVELSYMWRLWCTYTG